MLVGIENGQPVGTRLIERTHHLSHRCRLQQCGLRLHHQLSGLEMVIEFGAEHHITNLHNLYLAQQYTLGIKYRKH